MSRNRAQCSGDARTASRLLCGDVAMLHEETAVQNSVYLQPHSQSDARGRFEKVYSPQVQRLLGITVSWVESFWTYSDPGVVRGMHVQAPPEQCWKLVWCVQGSVFDVVVDLRVDSPSYLAVATRELSAERGGALLIPPGCAHGFATTTSGAAVCYLTDRAHVPALDIGIRWDSVAADWPLQNPEVSARDDALPRLEDFHSPFRLRGSDAV